MPTVSLPRALAEQAVKTLEECLRAGYTLGGVPSAVTEAANRVGIDRSTFRSRVVAAKRLYGLEANISSRVVSESDSALRKLLKKSPHSLDDMAAALNITPGKALDMCNAMKAEGVNLHRIGERYSIEQDMAPAFTDSERMKYKSTSDNKFKFGVVADSHLCSKYERLDVLNDLYDRFADEGITHVFHCGNWIEGEARFNRTDVHVHGLGAQINYLVKNYPKRPDMVTYAVTGDDHEGWYAQREGIDIGHYAEIEMRRNGREDWMNLGYMESHVDLTNANTGASAVLAVVHPGGGSAYADSYVVQKIIESLEGGEKPAVALYGHYHKMLAGEYRNVWWVLVPSTKDQDIFMRKKRIRSVVGGGIVELEQDPESGAIVGFNPRLWRYFNKGFYGRRWSHSGDVVLPERARHG